MKNSIRWSFVFFVLFSTFAKAQKGLENIIVEKYYISTAADTIGTELGGYLPIGSVTYRVFADLTPVHRLQAIYGEAKHELKITTTTRFFNCAKNDGKSSTDIEPSYLKESTLLLDSWVSVGAACLDYQAVLKSMDDSLPTFVESNELHILRNDEKDLGIPLASRDGMKKLKLQPGAVFFNFDKELQNFQYAFRDSVDGIISTLNGAWASFGGSVGPHPKNQVLLGQFTTDGVFSFELNLLIAIPGGGSEKFVAKNAVDSEFVFPALIYSSSPNNKSPQILLAVDQQQKKKGVGAIELLATTSDEDGKVVAVDFYVNDRLIYTDSSFPFTFSYHGNSKDVIISASAIDDKGAKCRSKNIFLSDNIFQHD